MPGMDIQLYDRFGKALGVGLRATQDKLALAIADIQARFQEAVLSEKVYTMILNATTTGVAAGNIVGAAAAAATQFALFNPVGSGYNYVLWQFAMGIISGTPGAGPLFHGIFTGGVPTLASNGTARNNMIGKDSDTASMLYALAAGAALTNGNVGPVAHSVADFSSTATAQASVGMVKATEWLDGKIILTPGTGYAPLWSAAGTALLNAYGITYQKVPI